MTFLIIVDHAGVFVFALSGALLAVRHRLDMVSIVVLALVTSLAGGQIRRSPASLHPM